uniref:Zinc finger protein n=1 Tax=Schizaphis graminum TaxID=13262 RepID=A0A2S2NTP9_SCHGA
MQYIHHFVQNLKCKCKVCNVQLKCGKSELEKHASSQKHKLNVRSISSSTTLSSFMTNKLNENPHLEAVKKAEIQLAAFFAEHNVAFNVADHLIPLLKDIFCDSKIAKDLEMHRKKLTNIIKNVIAPMETSEVIKIIKNQPFSILVDESTDITVNKFMCVLVRFVHPISGNVQTRLLELVCLNATDCSANNIFKQFEECLKTKDISISNIIGIASDGANVMVGEKNSFVSRLKSCIPNLILMKCICHSSALVASKACKMLPRSAEDLIRSVASYVSGSAKRSAQLVEIQEIFDGQRKKILKLADTRWLALHQCVVRMLDCWTSLQHFFLVAVQEDKLKSGQSILNDLNNTIIKCYFFS